MLPDLDPFGFALADRLSRGVLKSIRRWPGDLWCLANRWHAQLSVNDFTAYNVRKVNSPGVEALTGLTAQFTCRDFLTEDCWWLEPLPYFSGEVLGDRQPDVEADHV